MTATMTAPDDEFGGWLRDHFADLPDAIIPAAAFDELLMALDNPDRAPALAEAAAPVPPVQRPGEGLCACGVHAG